MTLLAEMDPSSVRKLYKGKKIPGFKKITDLLTELKQIKKMKYAEVINGHHSIAVTVGDPAFAAIAFSGKITKKKLPGLVK